MPILKSTIDRNGEEFAANRAHITVTLLHALKARGGKRGIASLCIGGGEVTAIEMP